MSEIASVSAGQRARLVQDALRVRDDQRAEVVAMRERATAEAQRIRQVTTEQVRLAEQRVRDRRGDLEFEQSQDRELGVQQQILDVIANDTLFERDQDQVQIVLNETRDNRQVGENLLVRDIAGARNDAIEIDTLAQRAEDLRQALIDREGRLTERRAAERASEIRQQADLRSSVSRVGEAPQRTEDTPRGSIVDVGA